MIGNIAVFVNRVAPVFVKMYATAFHYFRMLPQDLMMVVFGLATRDRKAQVLVASVFCVASILLALRDLSTSDTPFGSALYEGPGTVFFVFVSLVYAGCFGGLAFVGLRRGRAERG